MSRTFNREDSLVIASHNSGKVREITDLLQPLGIKIIGAGELGLIEPEETGQTFIENAVLKASLAAEAAGCRHWLMIQDWPSMLWAGHQGFILRAGPGRTKILPRRCAGSAKPCFWAVIQTEAVPLSVLWRWPGQMATQKVLKAGLPEP